MKRTTHNLYFNEFDAISYVCIFAYLDILIFSAIATFCNSLLITVNAKVISFVSISSVIKLLLSTLLYCHNNNFFLSFFSEFSS